MSSLFSLDEKQQTNLLEGVAALSHIFWGPELENSRDLLRGIYLKPFETLKPIVSYEPPGVIDELKAINTSFTDEDAIFQFLEQAYVGFLLTVATVLPPRSMRLVMSMGKHPAKTLR